jgi:hypothetical protein
MLGIGQEVRSGSATHLLTWQPLDIPMLLTLILVTTAFALLALAVARRAPMGDENEQGFHGLEGPPFGRRSRRTAVRDRVGL